MSIIKPGHVAGLALLGIAWAALSTAAPADAPAAVRSEMKSALFRMMDVDSDGIVTKAEFDARSTGLVKELAGRDPDLAERFLLLTPDEQKLRFDQRFASIDANRDGRIDDREWASARPSPLLPG
ncbi:hypothetical protein D3874_07350 [Oleomonas cavernae]|uniref:EF-hand domain-containing protein n=1 Tax=Oleomonas cavernae TaxID=2320859 RepID=A0A418WIP6_9PROT|nr:hypothetical protein [Oleomonas cavernae]RJF89898.1 hypothetical protein D3874_07350 [Oleomonas cavernae]